MSRSGPRGGVRTGEVREHSSAKIEDVLSYELETINYDIKVWFFLVKVAGQGAAEYHIHFFSPLYPYCHLFLFNITFCHDIGVFKGLHGSYGYVTLRDPLIT